MVMVPIGLGRLVCARCVAQSRERLADCLFTLASDAGCYLMAQGLDNERALRASVMAAKALLKN
jgi:hypothetical protein